MPEGPNGMMANRTALRSLPGSDISFGYFPGVSDHRATICDPCRDHFLTSDLTLQTRLSVDNF